MYRHMLDKVVALREIFHNVVLVTQYDEIIEDTAVLPLWSIKNLNPEAGVSHSIRLGLQWDRDVDGWVFLTCDQPHIKAETIRNFIEAFEKSGKGIGCIAWDGFYGNPAVFLKSYEAELLSLDGDRGGKRIIEANKADVFFYHCPDPAEFDDYDTPPGSM